MAVASSSSSSRCKRGSFHPLGSTVIVIVGSLIIIFLSMVGLCLGDEGGNSYCKGSERRALLDIKADISDDPHHVWLSSWEGEDCCSWRGVGCDNSTGHVIKLDLKYPYCGYDDYNYEVDCEDEFQPAPGKLSPSLRRLTHLEYLDLSMNDFSGAPIPEFIGSLVNLQYLNLSYAGFGGTIPPHLGNLTNLHYLDLSSLPDYDLSLWAENLHWLSGTPALKHLGLSAVNLSKTGDQWIHDINMLPSLSVLYLSNSELDSIPITLPNNNHVNFTSLTVLDLSDNYFNSTIPGWLFSVTSLVHLDLGNSLFSGNIPETLGHLSQLEYLDMSMNTISGEMPNSIGDLYNLKYLDLSVNTLTGRIPDTIGDLQKLVELNLFDNYITEQIPHTIRNLHSLRTLMLSRNKITGKIPDSVGSLHNLVFLDVSVNNITGRIPETVGNLLNLTFLILSSNNISGWIPKNIGNLSKLSSLDLSDNQISGSIPESVGNLSQLKALNLSDNRIGGKIPKTLGSLCNSRYLDLSYNNIEGSIKDFTEGLSRCHDDQIMSQDKPLNLYLGNNNLSGTIPASLGQVSRLTALDLSSNSFVGALAQVHFANLTRLYSLYLSHNQMTGELPILWKNRSLIHLDASFNNFSGPVPNWNVSDAVVISLSRNSLTGTIPLCFTSAKQLRLLSLSHNRLNGNIPDNLFCSQSSIEVLDLSNNRLSGRIPNCLNSSSLQIPSSMNLLYRLQSLHLSNNDLYGEIPSLLEEYKSLVVLDLGENKLTGIIPTWIWKSLLSLRILRLRSNLFDGIIPAQLSNLPALQVLDLAHNNLSGNLPRSFGSFSTMVSKQNFNRKFISDDDLSSYYSESILVYTKGEAAEYTTVLSLVTSIDLSGNILSGDIPVELANLHGLIFLNLSRNHFKGKIPDNIGALEQLESLDLSQNNLSGKIPQSMAELSFLSHLNLSTNNLSGRIPSGNQFETFDDTSIYGNNPDLCGWPLPNCLADVPAQSLVNSTHQDQEEGGNEIIWLYTSVVLGFILGFWGIIGTIMMKPSIRYAFFRVVDEIYDWFYVQIAVNFSKLKAFLPTKN